MSADEVYKIFCTPSDMEAYVTGASLAMASCGHEVWLSPSTRAVVEDPSVETFTVCMRCVDPTVVIKMLMGHGGVQALPETREEMNEELGVAETDQIFARFKITEVDPRQ